MSKHTAGPWSIDKVRSNGGAPIVMAETCWIGNRREIAKVLYHFGSEDPEVYANARLIAAAPAMYEALLMEKHRHTMPTATFIKSYGCAPNDHAQIRKRIDDALAQAEGK